MKKYHMAWVCSPQIQSVRLGSTDTTLIKWFLGELKKMSPSNKINNNHLLYDLDGNITYCEASDTLTHWQFGLTAK